MKTKETTPKDWQKGRRCKYCRLQFTPARPQDAQQEFCQPSHRNEYYRHGAMPFPKLVDALTKAVGTKMAAELGKQFAGEIENLVGRAVAAELRKQIPALEVIAKALAAEHRQAYADSCHDETPDNQADSLPRAASSEREASETATETTANEVGDGFAETVLGGAEIRGNGGTGETGGSDASVHVGRKKRAPRRERVFVSEAYGAQVEEA